LSLAALIRRILDETPVERLRLSSIEPQHVTDELLRVWTDHRARCLPHFHLPLQSGDDGILRRMGRRYDTAFYRGLVERLRSAIPGVAVHADVIVGFPSENEAAFERSRAFIVSLAFAGLHVFRYSERPLTPALRMTGHVPERVRHERSAVVLAHAAERRAAFAGTQIGAETRVLFERRTDGGAWVGHAENHVLVEVRPRAGVSLDNTIARVRIVARTDVADRVRGEILAVLAPPSAPAVKTTTASARELAHAQ
jgi:threonylcarbamoyladenosine tRNA methylthiotransferase MtaB